MSERGPRLAGDAEAVACSFVSQQAGARRSDGDRLTNNEAQPILRLGFTQRKGFVRL